MVWEKDSFPWWKRVLSPIEFVGVPMLLIFITFVSVVILALLPRRIITYIEAKNFTNLGRGSTKKDFGWRFEPAEGSVSRGSCPSSGGVDRLKAATRKHAGQRSGVFRENSANESSTLRTTVRKVTYSVSKNTKRKVKGYNRLNGSLSVSMMVPFLFHKSKKWLNSFQVRINDQNPICPIEYITTQFWIYSELSVCMRQREFQFLFQQWRNVVFDRKFLTHDSEVSFSHYDIKALAKLIQAQMSKSVSIHEAELKNSFYIK